MKKIPYVLAVAAVGGGAFLVYWYATRFERWVSEAQTSFYVPEEHWALFKQPEHIDDPRVIAAATRDLQVAVSANGGDCAFVIATAERHAAAILDKHPTSDDASLQEIGKRYLGCHNPRFLKWTTRWNASIVPALIPLGLTGPSIAKELETMGAKVSQDLIDAIVFCVDGKNNACDAHVQKGFPENGATFGPVDDGQARLDPRSDPRLVKAVRRRLGKDEQLRHWSIPPLVVLCRLVRVPLDAHLVKILESGRFEKGIAELADALISRDDVALVKKQIKNQEALAALLGPFAGGADLAAFIRKSRRTYASDKTSADSVARQRYDQWREQELALFMRLGPEAKSALVEALLDKDVDWITQELTSRTLARFDRHLYAQTIAQAMRNKTSGDPELMMELLGGEPWELEPYFAALSLGREDIAKKVRDLVANHLPVDVWVPALFDNLERAQETSTSLNAYSGLFYPGTAPALAKVLETKLKVAGGPEGIYWISKRIALEALGDYGTKAERPIVEKFLADRSSYDEVRVKRVQVSGREIDRKTNAVYFATLAGNALQRIDQRGK